MTDQAAFELAIRADPENRTVRLVYADWLDEHEDPTFAAAVRADTFPDVVRGIPATAPDLRTGWAGYEAIRLLREAIDGFSETARQLSGAITDFLQNGREARETR